MSSSDQKASGAVGAKAARPCDSCVRRRARWYCAADDAFLCQGCDTSVHSANPLARRHVRVRLRVPCPPPQSVEGAPVASAARTSKRLGVTPAWSKRKARTRRPPVKSVGQLLSRRLVVPEVGAGGESSEERKAAEEEQLLYRVPIFDPALAECFSPLRTDDAVATTSCCREDIDGVVENTKEPEAASSPVQELPDSCPNLGPTDAELREFAADMEALLGQGLDDSSELEDSFYMETLGLLSPAQDSGRVKLEADGVVSKSRAALASGPELKPEASAEVLDRDFNCSSQTAGDDDDSFEQKTPASDGDAADAHFFKRGLDLRLNYETIIANWGSSPWTDGRRPHVQLDDFLLHDLHSGMWTAGGGRRDVETGTPRSRMDGWREARVSRYREKRRTRLFAKKIRYEVRKLNAEKRPRMKGRFVKRPAGGADAAAAPCAVT